MVSRPRVVVLAGVFAPAGQARGDPLARPHEIAVVEQEGVKRHGEVAEEAVFSLPTTAGQLNIRADRELAPDERERFDTARPLDATEDGRVPRWRPVAIRAPVRRPVVGPLTSGRHLLAHIPGAFRN